MIGACVWFSATGPEKRFYRYYNLDKIKKSDDYEAMHFIITRRLKRLMQENNLPDMILVDGGKGQITQAKLALKQLSLKNIVIYGIMKGENRKSKNDKIIDVNNKDVTNNLQMKNIKILQTIRDEAHRFAIMSHRKKTTRNYFHSKLDHIPGVGEKRKHQILQYFGGIQAALKSSIDDLQNVPGINKSLAELIYNHLQK